MSIRVMSFNVLTTDGEPEHVSDPWTVRADLNVRTIRRYAPDLIGFQEFDPVHEATYQATFPEYGRYVDHKTGAGTAVFWNESRFEALDTGTVQLPRAALPDLDETEDDPLMGTTWARLRRKENSAEIILLNTHLNDESETARREGTKLNLKQIVTLDPRRTLPVLMTGDFNCDPWSHTYRQLLADGFVDTYREAGHGDSVDSSTFHGFHGSKYFSLEWGSQLFWRVDWIMLRAGTAPVRTLSCTIVRDAEPPIYPSDHYPLVTELDLD